MQLKRIVVFLMVLSLVSVSVFAGEVVDEGEKLVDEGEVVAVVGEQEITSEQLESHVNTQQLVMQLAQNNQTFAQLLSSTEEGEALLNKYREVKLDELIEETILKIEAENRGITVSEDEKNQRFNEYIQQIKEQNNMTEEQILETLSQQGIKSLEEYKEMFIANSNLRVNKLLEKEVFSEITVSEQEVEEFYNDNQDQIDQPYSEIKEELKENVRQQKQQEALSEFIDNAKDNLEIEKYI
ncbi:MAG: SurA N-terminal domain-containing protein [Bacillota bacterium]